MEAVIFISTPDAGVFMLGTDQKPMEAKPFLSPRSSIVEMAFNGVTIAVATSDRTIKYYTMQVKDPTSNNICKCFLKMYSCAS